MVIRDPAYCFIDKIHRDRDHKPGYYGYHRVLEQIIKHPGRMPVCADQGGKAENSRKHNTLRQTDQRCCNKDRDVKNSKRDSSNRKKTQICDCQKYFYYGQDRRQNPLGLLVHTDTRLHYSHHLSLGFGEHSASPARGSRNTPMLLFYSIYRSS